MKLACLPGVKHFNSAKRRLVPGAVLVKIYVGWILETHLRHRRAANPFWSAAAHSGGFSALSLADEDDWGT
jgi:hypothetical protein